MKANRDRAEARARRDDAGLVGADQIGELAGVGVQTGIVAGPCS